jgi:hypothetical protein
LNIKTFALPESNLRAQRCLTCQIGRAASLPTALWSGNFFCCTLVERTIKYKFINNSKYQIYKQNNFNKNNKQNNSFIKKYPPFASMHNFKLSGKSYTTLTNVSNEISSQDFNKAIFNDSMLLCDLAHALASRMFQIA